MKASDAPNPQLCAVRSYSILEFALHGVPPDVLEVLFERPVDCTTARPRPLSVRSVFITSVSNKSAPIKSVPVTVDFLTPTSARRCMLTVVGGLERWSVARFSTVWPPCCRQLPLDPEISRWNERSPAGQKLMRRTDGSILLCLDVDLDDLTLNQVIPIWLRWDRTVETAREFILFGLD
jgi:hypothetical protein